MTTQSKTLKPLFLTSWMDLFITAEFPALFRYVLNILQTDLRQCPGYVGPLQKEKIPTVIPLSLLRDSSWLRDHKNGYPRSCGLYSQVLPTLPAVHVQLVWLRPHTNIATSWQTQIKPFRSASLWKLTIAFLGTQAAWQGQEHVQQLAAGQQQQI